MTPKRRGFLKSFLGFIRFYLNRYIKKNDAHKNQTVSCAQPSTTTGNKNQTVTSPSATKTTTEPTVEPSKSSTSTLDGTSDTVDQIPFSFVKRKN